MKKYSRIGYIARLQPAHIGHIKTIIRALSDADEVLVMIGSSYQSKSSRNPFSYEDREQMLRACFNDKTNAKIKIVPLPDSTYQMEKWVSAVQDLMERNVSSDKPMALIGHDKDHTTFYLNYFPQWEYVEMENVDGLHSTDIRNIMFSEDENFSKLIYSDDNESIPSGVKSFLKEYFESEDYQWMRKEYQYNKNYNPKDYPVAVITVDSVVICSGHILLIKRSNFPGKGLWALPGGHVEVEYERLHDAAYRELKEETKLDIPPAILKSYFEDKTGEPRKDNYDYFDNPTRSARARVITHVWLVHLPPQIKGHSKGKLPVVKAADDAIDAKWVPISKFYNMEPEMFEDHWQIAQSFISKL